MLFEQLKVTIKSQLIKILDINSYIGDQLTNLITYDTGIPRNQLLEIKSIFDELEIINNCLAKINATINSLTGIGVSNQVKQDESKNDLPN